MLFKEINTFGVDNKTNENRGTVLFKKKKNQTRIADVQMFSLAILKANDITKYYYSTITTVIVYALYIYLKLKS